MATSLKQRRGEETRADIVRVARRLFSEHGYHRSALADIQAATGLTKGAFYHHFRSKEELALAVLDLARREYTEQWIEPAMQHKTPLARMTALIDTALALNARPEWCNCQMLATLCAEMTTADERLREAVRQMQLMVFELWRDLILEAHRRGEISRGIDAAVAAQWIMSTMSGAIMARKLGTLQIEPHRLFDQLKGTLLAPPVSHAAQQPVQA